MSGGELLIGQAGTTAFAHTGITVGMHTGATAAAHSALSLVVPVAAVAGGALAAVLAIRAGVVATGVAGRALEQLGDAMEQLADARDDAYLRARLWENAASAAAHTNQELRLLAARAEQVGIRPDLPPFVDLTGCVLADTYALVSRTEQALNSARVEVIRAEAERDKRVLLAKLAVPTVDLPTAAEVLADYRAALAARWVTAVAEPKPVLPPMADESWVHTEVDKALCRLDHDATADERAQVLAVAALAERKSDIGLARTRLEALADLVDLTINPKVGRRRKAAGLLTGLTHPAIIALASEPVPPRPTLFASIEGLEEVVRGKRELTDADRALAHQELSWAAAELERRRLLDALTEAFAHLGYAVTTGMQVTHSSELSVTHKAWDGQYTAKVWVNAAGNVQSRLVQVAPNATGEASRCAELNSSLIQVGEQLAQRGLSTQVNLPSSLLPAERDIVVLPSDLDEVVKPKAKAVDHRTSG
jgi:hypothetical protein